MTMAHLHHTPIYSATSRTVGTSTLTDDRITYAIPYILSTVHVLKWGRVGSACRAEGMRGNAFRISVHTKRPTGVGMATCMSEGLRPCKGGV